MRYLLTFACGMTIGGVLGTMYGAVVRLTGDDDEWLEEPAEGQE